METTLEGLSRRQRQSAWVATLVATAPGLALAWWMSANPVPFGHLLGASIALLIAGVILLTQSRTRALGIGLIIGFATCYYTAITPGLVAAIVRLF